MKKKTKLLILASMFLLCTGCTETLKDGKEVVTNKETGQTLTANILCKPTDKEMLKLYEKYNKDNKKKQVKIEKLDECKNMKITGKYHDLWTNIFVKPLAWFIIQLGNIIKNYGWALILATLFIRLAAYPFTKKAALQSENMKKAAPEIQRIEKKSYNQHYH